MGKTEKEKRVNQPRQGWFGDLEATSWYNLHLHSKRLEGGGEEKKKKTQILRSILAGRQMPEAHSMTGTPS